MQVKDVLQIIDRWAPFNTAAEWDNVGLQIGDAESEVTTIFVALDADEAAIDEAADAGAELIVAHHPLIFQKLNKLTAQDSVGRAILKAARYGINIIAAHTNLDIAAQGVSFHLAERLGLVEHKVLVETGAEQLLKLAVMVPVSHEEQVREAICTAGAGHIGNYSHCTFSYPGTGTFKPEGEAKPFIGEISKLECVAEVKIESILPQRLLANVLAAMLKAHPYEEVAYDLIPLANKGKIHGYGRIGYLTEPLSTEAFLSKVKRELNCEFVRFAGYYPEKVNKVAVFGGSGADFIGIAAREGADVFVTADIKYHQAAEAKGLGLLLVDPGHDITERLIVPALASFLTEQISNQAVRVIEETPRQAMFSFC